MTYYTIDSDGDYTRAPDVVANRREGIHPGVYELRSYPTGTLYLHPVGALRKIPSKIYGTIQKDANRIVATYLDRNLTNLNTGVMLAGLKGSGKSLTVALTANELISKHNGVCILINSRVDGRQLARLLGSPNQPILLDFDEYEKVYKGTSAEDKAYQESLLTFLSGGMTTKILSMLSVNSVRNVDEHFINRPGRIFYHFTYGGLSKPIIREFAKDTLHDATKLEELCLKFSRGADISFDIMSSVIQEINRYGCPVTEALNLMGYGSWNNLRYQRVVLHRGVDVSEFYDYTAPQMGIGTGADYQKQFDRESRSQIERYLQSESRPFGIPAEVFEQAPERFYVGIGKSEVQEIGETGLLLSKTSDSDICVIWYNPDDNSAYSVVTKLEQLGLCQETKKRGKDSWADITYPTIAKNIIAQPAELFASMIPASTASAAPPAAEVPVED